MSSETGVGVPGAERPRVPGAGSSSLGESGPKARPTGVVDGQRVDIPVPALDRSMFAGVMLTIPDPVCLFREACGGGRGVRAWVGKRGNRCDAEW